MRANRVKDRWNAGDAAVCAWLSLGHSYSAEIMAWSGVDAVLVDLQHGMIDIGDMIGMLQAISSSPATPLVRVPSLDAPAIMKALDAGAYGLVCPMVEDALQAEEFVAATRYPPAGVRSFGPARGLLYGGADYFEHADSHLVRLAMIETERGVSEVDAICSTKGLDGIFIGPNDLGLALGHGPAGDPVHPAVIGAVEHCLATAKGRGKHAGIFCPSGSVAARRVSEGFDFVVPNSDINILKFAAAAEAHAAQVHRRG
jgi:4-hydroxy-2-oxoheptanedioate aldolase